MPTRDPIKLKAKRTRRRLKKKELRASNPELQARFLQRKRESSERSRRKKGVPPKQRKDPTLRRREKAERQRINLSRAYLRRSKLLRGINPSDEILETVKQLIILHRLINPNNPYHETQQTTAIRARQVHRRCA